MKSDALVGLIKEVVKNEVKQQVKEELIKLVKSGIITVNKENKTPKRQSTPSLVDLTEINSYSRTETKVNKKPVKEITKNPMINQILAETTPFTAQQRAEGGPMIGAMGGGSILDALQPTVSTEGDWETMDFRGVNMPQQPTNIPDTDN